MFFKAKDMLRKAKNKTNGHHLSILSRWKAQKKLPDFVSEAQYWWKRNHARRPNCFGEPRLHSYESWTNTKFKALGSLDKCWRTSTTSTTTPRLCRSKKRMPATTRRVYGRNKAALQTNSSEQTNASKDESAIRRKRRLWLRCWSENRMDMVQRAAGKPAAYFVFVVLIMAEFLLAKLEFMVVAFFKARRRAVRDFFLKACSFGLLERSTDNSTGVHTEYTPAACIMNTTVFSHPRTWNACLWLKAQELNGSGLQRHHCAHKNSSVIWSAMSSPCWSLPHLLTSHPPQHEAPPGQHDLLQDDTVHRAPLPEPKQSTSSASEPLSHVNYESGGNPRNTGHTKRTRHKHSMPGLGGTINRLPHLKISWYNLQFLLQSSWMPNNRDFWQIELLMCTEKLHNDEFDSKKSKQENEKVSHPFQIHSMTEYLLSRTWSDRTHRVPRFFLFDNICPINPGQTRRQS